MKALTLSVLLLILALSARGGIVTLAWNAESPTNGVQGYNLYGYTNAVAATNVHPSMFMLDCGTNTMASVATTNVGQFWFGVTGYSSGTNFDGTVTTNGVESYLSSMVSVYFAPPPTNFMIMEMQYIATLGSTNWQSVGFFRLKLGPP